MEVNIVNNQLVVTETRTNWMEVNCCKCGEPIRWILDMWSFENLGGGVLVAGHARCLWSKDGFTTQRKLAPE